MMAACVCAGDADAAELFGGERPHTRLRASSPITRNFEASDRQGVSGREIHLLHFKDSV